MLVRRIRAEFEEMPGLLLTLNQAARLFGLSPETSTYPRAMGRRGNATMRADRFTASVGGFRRLRREARHRPKR